MSSYAPSMNSKFKTNSTKKSELFFQKNWRMFYMREKFHGEKMFQNAPIKKQNRCSKMLSKTDFLEHQFCFFTEAFANVFPSCKFARMLRIHQSLFPKKINFFSFLNIFWVYCSWGSIWVREQKLHAHINLQLFRTLQDAKRKNSITSYKRPRCALLE
jgi:hypothetical protein